MKFCPRCGTPVKGNEKFCTKCGFPLTGQSSNVNSSETQGNEPRTDQTQFQPNYRRHRPVNNQQNWQQANQTLNKAKNYSNGYFHWLFSTVKNPTAIDNNVSPYYGVTSIVAGMVLMFLSFYNIINNISSIFDNAINKFGGGGNPDISGFVDKIKGSSVKDAILICLISFIVYWLAGFLSRKFTTDRNLNAFEYSNQLATFTNAALICDVIVFLLTLISTYILASYVLMLTFVVYNVGLIYSIVRKSHGPGRLYAAVIASCCTPIAITLIIKYLIHSFIMNSLF